MIMDENSNNYNNFKETPFNMALLFYINLNKLIEIKNMSYLQNNTYSWYKSLKTIYRTIIFKIDKTDISDLDGKFLEVENMFNKTVPNMLQAQYHNISERKIIRILDTIDRDLMKIMDKKKMIFPDMDLKDGLAHLHKKYGLQQ